MQHGRAVSGLQGSVVLSEASRKELLLLFEGCLNASPMMCSNNITKYNSSHRENLVFAVNAASKQRHHFVFHSLTPFIILCFKRFPPRALNRLFLFEAIPNYPLCLLRAGSWLNTCKTDWFVTKALSRHRTLSPSPPSSQVS